ncbi:MAG: hypothetical protein GY906_29100 [bacterium]|nr:hypothetical protein [bacterium]
MDSAQHDLTTMVLLQGLYDQIANALAERQTPPPEVRELQEASKQRQRELEELEQKLEDHQGEISEVKRKESECQIELEHFQKQKGMVTNEREFTAVISEIDYATKALQENSDRRHELEAEIQVMSDDITERRGSREDEEATQNEVVTAWEDRKAELKNIVHDHARQAQELEAQLEPKNRARFARLLKSKGGSALAEVLDGSCSLCHFALRPHLQQRVRRAQEIIVCEHCYRVLYLAEMEESNS